MYKFVPSNCLCSMQKGNHKPNTIAKYAMESTELRYQGFLLRFCTHRNESNCIDKHHCKTIKKSWTIKTLSELFSGNLAWTPPPWQKLCLDKLDGGFLLGRISINNLMSTLTTNVEVYQPCRCTSVKPNINVYSTFKRQRFINYQ